jgi:hypothetical protein
MGKMIVEVHSCEPEQPRTDLSGEGSVWECDCGKRLELVRVVASATGLLAWAELAPAFWNEEEQRVLTQRERTLLVLNTFVDNRNEWHESKWKRFVSKLRKGI